MDTTALEGRHIVLTRPTAGRLSDRLRGLGALVDHVPLIEIDEASDGGAALAASCERLDSFDWLVVTSANGASRVGAAARTSTVRLAAVGEATAAALSELAGRPVDLVPDRQHTQGLLAVFPRLPASVLLAQGNLAGPELASGLRSIGCGVTVVEAYTTRHRRLTADERSRLSHADVVVLSSGSAVDAWLESESGPIDAALVAIGPKTAAVATSRGLPVAAVSSTPRDDDVVDAIVEALG